MRGMVFTEFMEMVEATWSLDLVDSIIAQSGVASGGCYTSVGNYPHEEIVALVLALSQETGIAEPDLIRTFGHHLFRHFTHGYPAFFRGTHGSFQLLSGIENVIHAEVRKLYPDAELPSFDVEWVGSGAPAQRPVAPGTQLILTYYSSHPFADLAHGLIEGCVAHYGEDIEIKREGIDHSPGAQARFTLTQRS